MLPQALRLLVCTLTMALGACVAASSGPHEHLDEKTAATVTTASQPLVFARERPELAAHSREYITLAGAAVNRSGALECYLFVYRWSTVDRRGVPDSALTTDNLT